MSAPPPADVLPAPQCECFPQIGPWSVIVADDVSEMQMLLEVWLQEAGCMVRRASTGNEVARLLREQPADLVVADVIMPDGDGLDVIMDLRRSQPRTRVLAISGGGRRLQAEDCLKFAKVMGADAVLLKPFDREQFLTAVCRAMQRAI